MRVICNASKPAQIDVNTAPIQPPARQRQWPRRHVLWTAAATASAWAGAASATSPKTVELEKAYDRYAATYDDLDGGAAAIQLGFPALRQQLLSRAHGAVLETAVGTGLNLPFYDASLLASLTAVDLSAGMLAQARRRVEQLGMTCGVQLVQADVERLQEALGGSRYDVVLDTFSLCVFPNPLLAVQEMAACLRPGGTLLLLEHSRSDNGLLGWYQDITAPAVMAAGGKSCRWNDNVAQYVEGAGLRITEMERHVGGLIVSIVAVKPP